MDPLVKPEDDAVVIFFFILEFLDFSSPEFLVIVILRLDQGIHSKVVKYSFSFLNT